MKAYWGVELWLHAFLTSTVDVDEWSASRFGRFTLRGRAPGTHWIGGCVGPSDGLDAVVMGNSMFLPQSERSAAFISYKSEMVCAYI
jgi:hypothetical protein